VDVLIHGGLVFSNKESEALSILLLEKLNMIGGKSAFLNSGSEAVNLAITMARKITGRKKILKLDTSFLSSFGYGVISDENENLINIIPEDFEALNKISYKEIAAFVFEPGNSKGLVRFVTEAFIQKLYELVHSNGGCFIVNEVTTGFGRTGKWFGFQHYSVLPDIVSLGKGLGNGYPVSAICVSKYVSDLFEKKNFRYAQSHQNDPLGCAIGQEVVKTFADTGIIEASCEKSKFFMNLLDDLKHKHPHQINEIRGRGMMIAVEFAGNISTDLLRDQLQNAGFIVGQKENVIRFMPPLTISESNIWELVNALDKLLQ